MAHSATTPTSDCHSILPIHSIVAAFTDPLACLSAHLLYECAEVLAAVKPANLVSLNNRPRSCGRDLYSLWQEHGHRLAADRTDICFKELRTQEKAVLLFCYNPAQLETHLGHSGIRALLGRAGYPADATAAELLDELGRRFTVSRSFPHEIGLFIGYPAKDVAAFMGLIKLPFTCQGPWKIYGNPVASLQLAERCRASRSSVADRLTRYTQGADFPDSLLPAFFVPTC